MMNLELRAEECARSDLAGVGWDEVRGEKTGLTNGQVVET